MTCPNCGKTTRPGAGFCGECGFKLPVGVPGSTPLVPQSGLLAPPPAVVAPAPIDVVSFSPAAPIIVPMADPSMADVAVRSGIVEDPIFSAVPGASAPVAPAPVAFTPPSEPLDETRVSVRRRAGAHWRLVLPDGRNIEVAGVLLVGRDASANPGWPGAAMLSIVDEAQSVSKTHAAFEVDSDGLWVTDLDSTNGVVITQPDGTELDLEPNARALAQPGADVELGDYIIQIEKD